MKIFTKILSIFLVLCMLTGTAVFGADFSDVKSDNKYYEPITILSSLEIIKGYEDGTFGPDRDVTRAEFATMLMRAMASAGIGSSDPAGTPFKDLNDASWAIGDIRTAYDLGIINGMTETTFEPNANVTYEQALKMIVCALNYGGQADALQQAAPGQPWYYGYLQTARSIEITKDVAVVEKQPAKRKDIAQMIYNSLDVKTLEKVEVEGGGVMYMESKQTWLKDKLKVTRSRGELLADGSNTIDPAGTVVRQGQMLVTDESNKNAKLTIDKNNISVAAYLGKPVEYMYRTDDYNNKILVLIINKSGASESIKVDAANIDSITGSYAGGYSVSYYESLTASRPVSLAVSANPTISINGEIKTNVPASALNVEAGTIEFISDGAVFNKINVESYETYVVKSVNKVDKYILDIYRPTGSNTLYIDHEDSNYDINMVNTSNSATTISSVSQYNVLTVRKGTGAGGRIGLDVTLSNKKASGVIDAKDTDVIKIKGKEYRISKYLKNYGLADLNLFGVGDSCTAYLDRDDNICYMVKTASSSTFYGYIADLGISDDVLKFAIASSKTPRVGSPYVLGADRITVDGVPYDDPNAVIGALAQGAALPTTNLWGTAGQYTQLVKYTINSAGAITEIDTGVMTAKEDPTDEFVFKPFTVTRKSDKTMKFNSSSNDFTGDSGSKFRINSSTQVIVVPETRTDYDSYSVKKGTSFFRDTRSYIIEPYNVSGSLNIAEAVVVYNTPNTEAKIEYSTPLFVISSVSQTTNADGDPCDKVVGYKVTTSGAVSEATVYTSAVGVISGKYGVGDIIAYVADNKGYLKDSADTLMSILDVDNFTGGFGHITNSKNGSYYYSEQYTGLLLGADVDGSSQIFDMSTATTIADIATEGQYSLKAGSNVSYIVYDSKDKKLITGEKLDLTSYPSYNETVSSGNPLATKIFVYKYSDVVRMIMIIK